MTNIVIVGGGGFAKEVAWLVTECNKKVVGFLDDYKQTGAKILAYPVLGKISDWVNYNDCEFIVAIGSPRIRRNIICTMSELGTPSFATLIHPFAQLSEFVRIGQGVIICSGCIVTVDVNVGNHSILNINSTIGHDCFLGDYTTIAPGVSVSGNTYVDSLVEIGTGACIRQNLKLGKGSMLGMGSVLTKNIPENMVFAGNPAKKIGVL